MVEVLSGSKIIELEYTKIVATRAFQAVYILPTTDMHKTLHESPVSQLKSAEP